MTLILGCLTPELEICSSPQCLSPCLVQRYQSQFSGQSLLCPWNPSGRRSNTVRASSPVSSLTCLLAYVVPIVGMLCGATISGVVVAVRYILKEFQESKDKIEIYLAFGATRAEACRPLAVQALKLALTPCINGMRFVLSSLRRHTLLMLIHSVLGIISIPGMMTGAILGGSSVHQAAKMQMIIMFMITASTTLASVFLTFAAIFVLVDREHRVRSDRIEGNGEQWFNVQQWDLKKFIRWFTEFQWRPDKHDGSDSERELLIA